MNRKINKLNLVVLGAFGFGALCSTSAQEIVPSMEWERLYEDSACIFGSAVQTDEGGYILGGIIYEVADDEVLAEGDGVVVKIDNQGEVQWQKIYGGTGYEEIGSVWQTSDGGYLFVGSSDSSPSGNKESTHFGLADAWVVKLDSQRNKQWEQSFGGTAGDVAASVWQTIDGGYVLAGYSASSPSGNKESPKFGISDGWVLKIDAQGNKQWDRSFGGESVERFSSVRQTADQGYVLAGRSSSPLSGNKEAPHFGGPDGWLVKVDAEGNKQWEHSFGGTECDGFASLDQAADGGFILGGTSISPPSGNKESFHFGGTDYWIVKVDAAGNKQWERSYGTPAFIEELRVVRQTSDQGYVLGGNSGLIKTDSRGHQQWEESFGGSDSFVEINDLRKTKDGGYILCGSYQAANTGPAFGCDRSSWVAKLENVVSRSGEVVSWEADAGVVLESVDDLNSEWKADPSEALSLGAANAIALVPTTAQQRYYRLRKTGTSSDVLTLSLGTLLSWPVDQSQILQFSSSKQSGWEEFPGDQGIIGETHYAIIPRNLRHHYFRTRKTD